jgi:hypothetical protein
MKGQGLAENNHAPRAAREVLLPLKRTDPIMPQLFFPCARGIAAAGLLALLGVPAGAATLASPASPVLLAQADTAPQAKPHRMPSDRVDARIQKLHDALKITDAQETQWQAVAAAMRDNAQTMDAAVRQRMDARGETAVEELKAYGVIAEAHAQGVQKLIPPFQALYDTLSDDQKKTADVLFSHSGRRSHRKSKT